MAKSNGNGKSKSTAALLSALGEQMARLVRVTEEGFADVHGALVSVATDVAAIKDSVSADHADHEVRLRELERKAGLRS